VSASHPSNEPGTEKRRSTRLAKSVPIKITGTDALGQTFHESTVTVMIDCYGCKYQSTHYAPKDSTVRVEIRRLDATRSSKVVQAKVVWVQRPKTYREVYHVALAFEVPGNVWGIPWPPSDWFPCPGEEPIVVAETPVEEPMAAAIASSPLADTGPSLSAQLAVVDEVVLDCTVEMMMALEKSKPRPRAASEGAHESQLAAMQKTARLAAADAVAEQIAAMQERINGAMTELIEEHTARVSAALEETRRELQALREALNAQPGRRGKGQTSKRQSKVPMSGAQ
jgi:DNA-binding FrmR family transcriptional regulator